jgi:hypothetical protein
MQPEDPPPGLPEGRSGIAVLVGGSSTGKTRACWEGAAAAAGPAGAVAAVASDPTRPDPMPRCASRRA